MSKGDEMVDPDSPAPRSNLSSAADDSFVIDLTDSALAARSDDGLSGEGAHQDILMMAANETPAVHAVVVAEHAGPYLPDVLLALGDQSYAELTVTVLNATGNEGLPDRYRRHHPFADWVTIEGAADFSAAANWALGNVDETEVPLLLILRDDTALAPGAVAFLVEEIFRSNAGIVGPKLVDWNDPSKLLSVGYGADRRGHRIDLIESDEFDQDQYSAVSDVFVIPAGAQLVRTDLFKHLGGFDPQISHGNEDLDLCWRAHAVAARVIVVPQATARIHNDVPDRAQALQRFSHRSRHRLRTLAVTASRWGFLPTLLTAIIGLLASAVGNLLRFRPGYARASLSAIGWNLRHWRSLRVRRRELRSVRKVGAREIHALQSRIGPSVGSLVEQSLRPSARAAGWVRSVRQSLVDERQRVGSSLAAFLGLAVLLIVLGTWDLIGKAPVVVGSNPILPGNGDLLREWWTGYRGSGLGTEAASPLSFAVLGLFSSAFTWSPSTLHLLLLVGPVFLGALGTFRLVRPLGGPRSAAVATAVAVANPLVAESFAAARWETIVLWSLAPFLLISAARLGDLEPWSEQARPLPARLVRFGALAAIGASVAPAAVFVAILAGFSLAVYGLVSGRLQRVGFGVAGALAAVVLSAAMNVPFSFDVLRGGGWSWVVGTASPEESVTSFAELILFAPGRSGGSILMWGLLAAASLGLLFGRRIRFDAALLGWTCAVVGFCVAWLGTSGFDLIPLPGADVTLTLASAGLSLGVGASVRSVQVDLKRYGYGWRQFATIFAALGAVAVLLLGFGKSLDGRHEHPEVGYPEITSLLRSPAGESRTLWLGDPRVLPVEVSTTARNGIPFAVTNGGTASIRDRFLPMEPELNAQVGDLIDVAVSRDTVRLGRLLAPFGIDYVIFQPQLAPAPYVGPSFEIDPAMAAALNDQLDMRRQAGTLNLLVFRNEASSGSVLAVNDSFDVSMDNLRELLDSDLSTAQPVPVAEQTPGSIRFEANPALAPGTRLLVAQPATGWLPTGGADSIDPGVGGTAVLTVADPSVPFGMERQIPLTWWAWKVVQLAMIVGALIAAGASMDRRPEESDTELVLDLRSDRQIARDLEREGFDSFEREPVGDAL